MILSVATVGLALVGQAAPPCVDTVVGRVVDEISEEPVIGALVRLGDQSVQTDSTGHFELIEVCPGDHALSVERANYQTVQRQVSVDGDTEVDVHALPQEIEHVDHVLVRVSQAEPTRTRASTTLEGEALARTRGKGLADSVAGVAGVAVLRSAAGGLGKPIIRGQVGRRNLILYDGVRHEAQRWGLDHAPEIDPFSAGSITVEKGAGSIRYGPDAVGGVVLVEPPPLPRAPGVSGEIHGVGVSNGRQGTVAARIDGMHRRLPGLAWRAEGNLSRAAASVAPDYPLDNTGSFLWNAGGTMGYLGKSVDMTLSYRRHFQKLGLCRCLRNDTPEAFEQSFARQRPVGADLYTSEYAIERAYQRVTHDQALMRVRAGLTAVGEISANYSFQNNNRQEFGVVRTGITGPQLVFALQTHAGELGFEHSPVKLADGLWLEGTAGVGASRQVNRFGSNETLIPDYGQWSGGVFVLERVATEHFELNWGIRYDGLARTSVLGERDYVGQTGTGRLESDDCVETSDGGGRCRFPFHAASGSYGIVVRAIDALELRLDLVSAARFPNVDEQLLNGAAPSFPVLGLGDSSLGVERTWGSSLTAATNHRWIATETSIYLNYIDDYIYFSAELSGGELGLNETVRGLFPVFRFQPIDAVFYGAEHSVEVAPPRWPVSVSGQAAWVRAFDVAQRDYLVFVPADHYRLGVSYHWPEWEKFRNGYISVGGTLVDRQRRFELDADFAPPPPGYGLLSAAAGVQRLFGAQVLSLALEGNNLTNARYRQYTSLLRYFADEPGWELRLRMSLEF